MKEVADLNYDEQSYHYINNKPLFWGVNFIPGYHFIKIDKNLKLITTTAAATASSATSAIAAATLPARKFLQAHSKR